MPDSSNDGPGVRAWLETEKSSAEATRLVINLGCKKDAFLYQGALRVGDSVRVVYRDGTTEKVDIVRPSATVGSNVGFFLLEVTDERRRKGFARFEALDPDSKMVASVPAPPVG